MARRSKRQAVDRNHKNGNILDLPTMVLTIILSRVELKALYHCMCVCKTFLSIIIDPFFSNVRNNKPTLLLRSPIGRFSLLELGKSYNYSGRRDRPIQLKPGLNLPFRGHLGIIDSCNGLICLHSYSIDSHEIFIWNPIVGEHVELPQMRKIAKWYTYGFGFCPKTSNYKVFIFSLPTVGSVKVEVDIITLGTTAWRRVEVSRDEYHIPVSNFVTFNGALHWIYRQLIYAFDLAEEQVRCIPLPSYNTRLDIRLVVLKNCLCIYFQDDFELHLWSMKEYRTMEPIWNKLMIKKDKACKLVPITSWNNGEIFYKKLNASDPPLAFESYDPDAQIFRKVNIYNTRPGVDAFNYVPSFTPFRDIFIQ